MANLRAHSINQKRARERAQKSIRRSACFSLALVRSLVRCVCEGRKKRTPRRGYNFILITNRTRPQMISSLRLGRARARTCTRSKCPKGERCRHVHTPIALNTNESKRAHHNQAQPICFRTRKSHARTLNLNQTLAPDCVRFLIPERVIARAHSDDHARESISSFVCSIVSMRHAHTTLVVVVATHANQKPQGVEQSVFVLRASCFVCLALTLVSAVLHNNQVVPAAHVIEHSHKRVSKNFREFTSETRFVCVCVCVRAKARARAKERARASGLCALLIHLNCPFFSPRGCLLVSRASCALTLNNYFQ